MTDEVDIPARELHLLYALSLMCSQYIGEEVNGEEVLDHMCMGAGEEACKALLAYGLITDDDRGALWTSRGQALFELNLNQKDFPA